MTADELRAAFASEGALVVTPSLYSVLTGLFSDSIPQMIDARWLDDAVLRAVEQGWIDIYRGDRAGEYRPEVTERGKQILAGQQTE